MICRYYMSHRGRVRRYWKCECGKHTLGVDQANKGQTRLRPGQAWTGRVYTPGKTSKG